MNRSKSVITSTFLRSLADAVDTLREDEINAVLTIAGLRKLSNEVRSKSKRKAGISSQQKPDHEVAKEIMSSLAALPSREEAKIYLEGSKATRAILVEAAKLRDVHIVKQDNVQKIIEKLVENVVGSRLDSEAIRNG